MLLIIIWLVWLVVYSSSVESGLWFFEKCSLLSLNKVRLVCLLGVSLLMLLCLSRCVELWVV